MQNTNNVTVTVAKVNWDKTPAPAFWQKISEGEMLWGMVILIFVCLLYVVWPQKRS